MRLTKKTIEQDIQLLKQCSELKKQEIIIKKKYKELFKLNRDKKLYQGISGFISISNNVSDFCDKETIANKVNEIDKTFIPKNSYKKESITIKAN